MAPCKSVILTEGLPWVKNVKSSKKNQIKFFVTVTDSLGINENFNDENATEGITDPVMMAVKIFESS